MCKKRNILFVDDEANVLQGLKRLLHPMRREWNTVFCQSGPEALERLKNEPFDVVVSDMRMPGMDGAELLSKVKDQFPNVVRIVLSGQSSQEATLKSVGVAHQFLAKPCDPERLRHTIDEALGLRAIMTNDALQRVISNIASVPSVPELYNKLVEEVQREDTTAQLVGKIVEKDPGMTTNILHLVNSAFFGLPRKISSAVQAVTLLGVETIKTLVLTLDVFSQFDGCVAGGISPNAIQEHSKLVASEAKRIGVLEKTEKETSDAILMAGLLHDIGKLLLAQNFPEEYRSAIELSEREHIALPDAETSVLGTTHAEVGGYLLGIWGLPDAIVEAVALHHCPRKSLKSTFSPLTAVHVANVLVVEHTTSGAPGAEFDREYLERLKLTDRIAAWHEGSERLDELSASA